jgi:hypothetical protein
MIAPSPLITGHDILSLPNPPSGSLIGEVLAQVLEEQAVGSIQSRDEAIRFAQDYLSKRNQE